MPANKTSSATRHLNRVATPLIMLLLACVCLTLLPASGWAASIYDAQVLQRIKFSGDQRSKVSAIIRQSDKEMAVIFRKHSINPNAKPEFDKLQKAASELQAIEAKEKRQMKKILSPEQYVTYLQLLQETAARVIKATRERP
ncbi:MAG: hypothetical protein V2I51_20025 [Anderseniella sp.]|jgi:hypothetical protein|nr:hypothetical protein [Anderseniella sp.]